jgi:hypothetical protein
MSRRVHLSMRRDNLDALPYADTADQPAGALPYGDQAYGEPDEYGIRHGAPLSADECARAAKLERMAAEMRADAGQPITGYNDAAWLRIIDRAASDLEARARKIRVTS